MRSTVHLGTSWNVPFPFSIIRTYRTVSKWPSFVGKYPPYHGPHRVPIPTLVFECSGGAIIVIYQCSPSLQDTARAAIKVLQYLVPTWCYPIYWGACDLFQHGNHPGMLDKNPKNLKSECVTSPSSLVVTRCMWRLVSSFFHAMQPLRDSARTTAIRTGQGRRAPTPERGEAHGGSVSLPQGLPLIQIFYKGHLRPTGPWLLCSSYID